MSGRQEVAPACAGRGRWLLAWRVSLFLLLSSLFSRENNRDRKIISERSASPASSQDLRVQRQRRSTNRTAMQRAGTERSEEHADDDGSSSDGSSSGEEAAVDSSGDDEDGRCRRPRMGT